MAKLFKIIMAKPTMAKLKIYLKINYGSIDCG
jgi:hypothetical protein